MNWYMITYEIGAKRASYTVLAESESWALAALNHFLKGRLPQAENVKVTVL